jgi:FMN phosphatase YigB (HAD superfamily)
MHFTKPHPEFYTEVVERLGLAPEECLMAGDDPENDLTAGLAGLETFLLTDFINPERRFAVDPTYEGKLQELRQMILDS